MPIYHVGLREEKGKAVFQYALFKDDLDPGILEYLGTREPDSIAKVEGNAHKNEVAILKELRKRYPGIRFTGIRIEQTIGNEKARRTAEAIWSAQEKSI